MFELLKRLSLHWTMEAAGLWWKRRFEASLAEAPDVGDELLAELLRENADTWYGRRHAFADIRSAAEYARRVPLSTYEDYREPVQRLADGEAGVLTAEAPRYIGVSSGTTGRGKWVPMTASAQKHIILHMVLLAPGVLAEQRPSFRPGPVVLVLSSLLPGRTKGGLPLGTATAAGMDRMGGMAGVLWSSPLAISKVPLMPVANHLHLLFALAREDLAGLQAPFAPVLLELLRTLTRDWRELADELEQGVVHPREGLDEALRAQLTLKADPARARAVREVCAQGFDGLAQRLWPHLRSAVCVVSGSFGVYREPLQRLLGPVPVLSPVYAASEGLIGVGLELDSELYALVPQSMVFEFIPLAQVDAARPEAVPLRAVRAGQDYELVVTTRSGFYRYRLGDVVRVEGFRGRAPLVRFLFRRGQVLDVCSEKTSEQALQEAVLDAARHWGATVVDFSSRADLATGPGRYEVFVEVEDDAPLRAHGRPWHTVDAALGLTNPGYRVVRDTQRLAAPVLHVVKAGTFARLKATLIAQGASPVQVKVPRVLARAELYAQVRGEVAWSSDGAGGPSPT